jgi:hypothetical protein
MPPSRSSETNMATARHHQAGRTRGGARPVGHRLGAVPRGRDGRMRHGACPDRLVQAARAARSTSRSPVARPSIRGQGKGVPRWSWLHSPIGIASLFVTTAVALSIATFVGLSPDWANATEANRDPRALIFLLPILVSLIICLTDIRSWIFPQFEITSESGAGSSGSKRLVYAIGTLITIPLGIFINTIS